MIVPVLIKWITEIRENQKVGQEHSDHIIIPWVNRDVNGAEPANPDFSSSERWVAMEFSVEHNPKTRCSLKRVILER